MTSLDFDGDPDRDEDPGIFQMNFYHCGMEAIIIYEFC